MAETPWFDAPPDATLAREGVEDGELIYGWLHFIDPNGNKAAVAVTLGPTTTLKPEGSKHGMHVWHIDLPPADSDMAVVSPSVHFVGAWHSPNPVVFRIVDQLPEE